MPLDPKTVALIAVACDVATAASSLSVTITNAISAGASEEELLDILNVARDVGVPPDLLQRAEATVRTSVRRTAS